MLRIVPNRVPLWHRDELDREDTTARTFGQSRLLPARDRAPVACLTAAQGRVQRAG